MTSAAEPLFTTPTTRLFWYPQLHLLDFSWEGFTSGAELREAFDRALALATEHKAQLWLTDFTGLSAMRQADQEWLFTDFNPRLASHLQLRRSALVRPASPLGEFFLTTLVARAAEARPWPVRGFQDRATALAWLLEDEELAARLAPRLNNEAGRFHSHDVSTSRATSDH